MELPWTSQVSVIVSLVCWALLTPFVCWFSATKFPRWDFLLIHQSLCLKKLSLCTMIRLRFLDNVAQYIITGAWKILCGKTCLKSECHIEWLGRSFSEIVRPSWSAFSVHFSRQHEAHLVLVFFSTDSWTHLFLSANASTLSPLTSNLPCLNASLVAFHFLSVCQR